MRVLMVSKMPAWAAGAGGEAIYLHEMGRALAGLGVEIVMLLPAASADRRILTHCRVEYIRPVSKKLLPFSLYLKVCTRLRRFHVIHLQGGEGACFVWMRRFLGGPCVIAAQQFNPRRRSWIRESVWRKYERHVSSLADVLCTPSAFTREATAEAFGLDKKRIEIVPGGVRERFIELGRRRGESPVFQREKLKFLSAAKLGRGKGTDTLLDAFSRMRRRDKAELILVGSGPLDEYRLLAQRLGVLESVRFMGYLGFEDLVEAYWTADAFVLPTRGESFGLALAEAMAAGLPTVSCKAGAVPELVDSNRTGILVPPESPEALAEALDRLVDHGEVARSLGQAAHEEVSRRYTWRSAAERMLALYEKSLDA